MIEIHPYGEFIPPNARWMIIGSFPIGKFTNPKKRSQIGNHEMDFFFGGEKNLLWKLLGKCFEKDLSTKQDVVSFLMDKKIAMGDVIKSCHRKGGGSSDKDLEKIVWNQGLLKEIENHRIKKIFFTSRQVEIWFNKLFPDTQNLEKVTLISPSGQSIRALPRRPDYRAWEKFHRGEPKFNFILEDYRSKFGIRG